MEQRPELMYTEHEHDPDIFKDVGGCGWILKADGVSYLFPADDFKNAKNAYEIKLKEYNDTRVPQFFEN